MYLGARDQENRKGEMQEKWAPYFRFQKLKNDTGFEGDPKWGKNYFLPFCFLFVVCLLSYDPEGSVGDEHPCKHLRGPHRPPRLGGSQPPGLGRRSPRRDSRGPVLAAGRVGE